MQPHILHLHVHTRTPSRSSLRQVLHKYIIASRLSITYRHSRPLIPPTHTSITLLFPQNDILFLAPTLPSLEGIYGIDRSGGQKCEGPYGQRGIPMRYAPESPILPRSQIYRHHRILEYRQYYGNHEGGGTTALAVDTVPFS